MWGTLKGLGRCEVLGPGRPPISKQGNRFLRMLLVKAAQSAVRYDPEFRREYQHRCHSKPRNVAEVAASADWPSRWFRLAKINGMPLKRVSQRTIVEVARVLQGYREMSYAELIYGNGFPDWLVGHAQNDYVWRWLSILANLKNGGFFFVPQGYGETISGVPPMGLGEAQELGEAYIHQLAALATTLPKSERVLRSLQLDGFSVGRDKLRLVPLEGPVSAQKEEDALTALVKRSGAPDTTTVLKHIADASSHYQDGKDHSCLGECRSFIQALIDGISTETAKNGKHSTRLPGGTANRIEYLRDVGFLTQDEEAAYKSAWGSLSAGSHPGVPDREAARIGLVLALEFGQLLLLKFGNWSANGYRRFK